MKTHRSDINNSGKIVVVGGAGFVGNAIFLELQKSVKKVHQLSRDDVDLLSNKATSHLSNLIDDGDIVVAAAAVAPAKNTVDLQTNIALAQNIADALSGKNIRYFLNISSDAVYGDEPLPLTENAPKAPSSFHGLMHLTRELIFSELGNPTGTLRPTLIYGNGDPHNGYGPNRFLRLARKDEDINLFGQGEEIRDHVLISDVAKLAKEMIETKLVGALNAVSGNAISFMEVAEIIIAQSGSKSKIVTNPRTTPMPHNGLRTFDNSLIKKVFPKYNFETFEGGIKKCLCNSKTR
jgi:UDP-glucose 4-epimerase